MFQNRREAGLLLAEKLKKYQGLPGVLLAVPRGGVPVAYEVARKLHLPLEVMLVKKIGHPLNKEYAIGAVGLEDYFVVPHEDVDEDYVPLEIEKVRAGLRAMKQKFMGAKEPENLEGKTVIVVDDGIATGNTLRAAIRILRKNRPAKIVVAAPVVARSTALKLQQEADELVALLIPETFGSVGTFYRDFRQVEDEEVLACLSQLNALGKTG